MPLTLAAGSALAQASADAVLPAWAEAYATGQGPPAAALYTPDARLWGTASRAQSLGHDAIAAYFARPIPGVATRTVRFTEAALRPLGPEAAVASGSYVFRSVRQDGSVVEIPARFSLALLRGPDGAWRIADHHSSALPPAPP